MHVNAVCGIFAIRRGKSRQGVLTVMTIQFGNVHQPTGDWTALRVERYLHRKKGVRALAVKKQFSDDEFVVTGKHKDAWESIQTTRQAVEQLQLKLWEIVDQAAQSGELTVRNEAQLKTLWGDLRNRTESFLLNLRRQEFDVLAKAKPFPNPKRKSAQ